MRGGSGGDDEAQTAQLNKPVRDGKFEFVVKSVECGETELGSGPFSEEAQGQFCIVSMRIENIGNKAQTLFPDDQLLFDGKREFSASSDVIFAYPPAEKLFLEEINPGNRVKGAVVFDIPKSAKPDRLELHDSTFSDGIEINL